MNYNLPTVDKITNFTANPSSKITDFKVLPREFFALYGNSYQIWNHVISAHIGRWQERRVQASQTHFPGAKQRYLDYMIRFLFQNAKKCTDFKNFYFLSGYFLTFQDYAMELKLHRKIGQIVPCIYRI